MDVKEIFDLVQHEPKNCNKYLKMLHNLYIKEEFSKFFASFNKHLLQAFLQPFPNCFAKAVISFASSFCLEIVTNFEKQMQHMENGEYESHPFFVHLIAAVLKCIPVDDNNVRYHASLLLAMLFTNFGPDISISDVICDKIQRAMLERAEDLKPHIRLQAITVLTRLQNPHDVNCPIIQRFINSLGDPSPLVRKAVVESIAPCRGTFLHIITRLRDVDGTVRASTYTKLLKVSPKIISIVNRQTILMNGFTENNEALQKKFKNVLLTKWLDVYENNVIEFMRALKLDANEEDLKQTEEIYELLLPIIFTMMPLQELIQLLGLDESKMIPIEELTIEKVTYWSCLISNLLNISDSNVDFEENIPTVVSMVTCIENFVKMKSDTSLELWQYFEYQQTLRKLFELILKLDNSDEFGRQKIRKLLEYVLTKVKMEPDVLNIVIKAFHNILPDTEQLAYEICSIITDIKDPLEPLELPIGVRREQDVQIAQLKVKHHMKTDELKKAIDEKQYEIVDKLSKEAAVFETQIKELQTKFAQPILVRKPHNDVEIICRCLDIAISFLEVLPIEKLPNSLVTFKEEFLTNNDIDIRYATIFQRIFKLSCLYSMIDRDAALQSLEGICAPLLNYNVTGAFNKNILKTSIGAVSDLIRLYGPSIFDDLSTKENNKDMTASRRRNDRTLYCEEDGTANEAVNAFDAEIDTTGVLIDIMLSILDDNHSDLRVCVAEALGKLIVKGLCVNSSLITRLLLKWFNPTLETDEKYDIKVQQYIGFALTTYVKTIKSAPSILEKVIIPTICYISNAPKTSPLAAVNPEDLLCCLIRFTKIREKTTLDVHKELAYSILSKVSKTNDQSVRILTKMLLLLEIPVDEQNLVRELTEQISIAQNNATDKVALAFLKKFYNKLNGITNENDTIASANTSDGTNGNIRSLSTSYSRKRKISNSDTLAIERVTEQLNKSENPPAKYPATRRTTRSCRVTSDLSLHTIEEQTENVQNDPYNAQTLNTNDSLDSSNSREGKEQPKKIASRSGAKKKGKRKTSSSSNDSSSE